MGLKVGKLQRRSKLNLLKWFKSKGANKDTHLDMLMKTLRLVRLHSQSHLLQKEKPLQKRENLMK
jgi:hypothetical protein